MLFGLGERVANLLFRRQHELQFSAAVGGFPFELAHRPDIEGIGDRHEERLPLHSNREAEMVRQQRGWKAVGERPIHRLLLQAHIRDAHLLAQGSQDIFLFHPPPANEHGPDRLAARPLLLQGTVQLLRTEQPLAHQQLS